MFVSHCLRIQLRLLASCRWERFVSLSGSVPPTKLDGRRLFSQPLYFLTSAKAEFIVNPHLTNVNCIRVHTTDGTTIHIDEVTRYFSFSQINLNKPSKRQVWYLIKIM